MKLSKLEVDKTPDLSANNQTETNCQSTKLEVKRYAFWWVLSNLPAVLWITIVNACGPFSVLINGLGINLGLWIGWLIFIWGISRHGGHQQNSL